MQERDALFVFQITTSLSVVFRPKGGGGYVTKLAMIEKSLTLYDNI